MSESVHLKRKHTEAGAVKCGAYTATPARDAEERRKRHKTYHHRVHLEIHKVFNFCCQFAQQYDAVLARNLAVQVLVFLCGANGNTQTGI